MYTLLLRVSQPRDHATSLLRHYAESQEGGSDLGLNHALQLVALARMAVHHFGAPSMILRQLQSLKSWALQVFLSLGSVPFVVGRMKFRRQLTALAKGAYFSYAQ